MKKNFVMVMKGNDAFDWFLAKILIIGFTAVSILLTSLIILFHTRNEKKTITNNPCNNFIVVYWDKETISALKAAEFEDSLFFKINNKMLDSTTIKGNHILINYENKKKKNRYEILGLRKNRQLKLQAGTLIERFNIIKILN
jgi:hypothetical protein